MTELLLLKRLMQHVLFNVVQIVKIKILCTKNTYDVVVIFINSNNIKNIDGYKIQWGNQSETKQNAIKAHKHTQVIRCTNNRLGHLSR